MKKIITVIIFAMLLLTSCGTNEEYVAEVGKSKITSNELEFYLDSVKSQMAGTELSTDEDWQTNEIEGKKAIDIAREKAVETAVNNVAYIEVGKALGIKLSGDDKKTVKANKERFAAQLGTESDYNEYLKSQNISDSFIEMLCESMIYSTKLSEKLQEESPITDEDIHNYYEKNKDDLNTQYRHAKHILLLTKDMTTNEEFTEEKQAEVKKKAEEILFRAKSGEDFDALAQEYSEDPGLATQPNGYVFGDGEMVKEFQDGTDNLNVGEIGLVKSDYGYHIILRMELAKEDVADRMKDSILSDKLDEQMKIWEEETGVEIQINNDIISKIN